MKAVNLELPEHRVTALIGPSGCGKSTFLRALNRMNDLIPGATQQGEVLLDGADVTGRALDAVELRRRVGMVFQKSNPFPKSIFENVAYGLRVAGVNDEHAAAGAGGPVAAGRRPLGRGEGPAPARAPSASRAASSSGSASPARWRCSPRCC